MKIRLHWLPRIAGVLAASFALAANAASPSPNVQELAWRAALESNQAAAYQAYLAEFPKGKYAPVARVKLAILQGSGAAGSPAAPAAQLPTGNAPTAKTPVEKLGLRAPQSPDQHSGRSVAGHRTLGLRQAHADRKTTGGKLHGTDMARYVVLLSSQDSKPQKDSERSSGKRT